MAFLDNVASFFRAARPRLAVPTYQPSFSPAGGCQDALVALIAAATESVHVLAYSFTSRPIADALIAAQGQRREVRVVVDRSQLHARDGQAGRLAPFGIDVTVDSRHAIAHNKVVIVDGLHVATGSFNLTVAAERNNAENVLIVRDAPRLAATYLADWQRHRNHSDPWPAAAARLTSTYPIWLLNVVDELAESGPVTDPDAWKRWAASLLARHCVPSGNGDS